jgi:hypothetical protein
VTAERTCDLSPFVSPVVAQVATLEQAGSALEILTQSLENFLARFRTAVCEDLTQIVEECCGDVPPPDPISFLDLTDTPNTYAGSGGKAVAVNVGETGLEFIDFPDPPDVFTALDKWINYSFALVAGTPLQTIGNGGGAAIVAATSTIPALATTNKSTETYKVQLVTANSANVLVYVIINTLLVARGTTVGFRWRAVVGGNSTVTNQRAFWGLRGNTANPTTVNPSTLTDIIGVGYDSGATTLSIYHNDNAGTAANIPLGANFPVAAGELFEIEFSCDPANGTVDYSVTRLNTGDVATGNISTELPATTQFLAGNLWVGTAGNAGVAQLWFHHMFFAEF